MVDDEEETTATAPEETAEPQPTTIVGVGASAGGLQALEEFFSSLPAAPNVAFVVIQHLSPNYKSLMVEILSKHTEMDVRRVEDGMQVEKNVVYLMPPNANVTIQDGRLDLNDRFEGINWPIDLFLRSLAQDQDDFSVGVILSGTGSDGSLGIRAIKGAGGIVMVQDEESAKFDGMPRSAIQTGVVDIVGTPMELAAQIVSLYSRPDVRSTPPVALPEVAVGVKILSYVRAMTSVDFAVYKNSTVSRRIARRMNVNQVDDPVRYLHLLKESEEEVAALYSDLLINVTEFFRDGEPFVALSEKVLPEIFQQKEPGAAIRVWCAGCATGEEAYSLAILFTEYMEKFGVYEDVKIFATDLDERALEFASAGRYPASIAADVSRERLSKFFVPEDDHYVVHRKLRRMVIFARHNVLRDPPFSKLDLVSCRNLLIYLKPDAQKRVLSLFHFALLPSRFYFTGASESVSDALTLFGNFDVKWKIFRHRPGSSVETRLALTGAPDLKLTARQIRKRPTSREERVATGQRSILASYLPPAIVVNDTLDVVHIASDCSRFVSLGTGPMNTNLLELVNKQLSIALASALHRCRRERTRVAYRDVIWTDTSGVRAKLDLVVDVLDNRLDDPLFVVVFEPRELKEISDDIQEISAGELSTDVQERIADLENELRFTKENLQATIEELETSNEELQATNEELLAANEELQSTNEELQSVNEELYTVNNEHQHKILELVELNNDMNNLLANTDIATVFLDEALCIRKFTPATRTLINLMDHDVGRPLNHISTNLRYAELVDDVQSVLRSSVPRVVEVQAQEGRWYQLRIVPYLAGAEESRGVVLTLVDISELKESNAELKQLHFALDETPASVVVTDPDLRVLWANRSALTRFSRSPGDLAGRPLRERVELTKTEPAAQVATLWADGLETGKASGEFAHINATGVMQWERVKLSIFHNENQGVGGFVWIGEDISQRKLLEDELDRRPHRKLRVLLVEDSPEDAFLAQRVLSAAGVVSKVTHVESAEDGLAFFADSDAVADLVLLDLNLPGMNGLEALPLFRERHPDVPVVVCTTDTGSDNVQQALKLGAAAFIAKPLTISTTLSVVGSLEDFTITMVHSR